MVTLKAPTLTRTLDLGTNGNALAYLDEEELRHKKTVDNGKITDMEEEGLTRPTGNYSYAFQAVNAAVMWRCERQQIRVHVNIQTLEEVIKASGARAFQIENKCIPFFAGSSLNILQWRAEAL